ncbi:hypothetical protein CUMW_266630 [Citrus unshiu]|uniref:Uncharacterized protein n=1 Tax=Citrus unshiu TaxID=55188 RepID=A0A2H5QVY9_CITUN|nr:hypothetical protein CUMW_266630 [Citrus unshiu]
MGSMEVGRDMGQRLFRIQAREVDFRERVSTHLSFKRKMVAAAVLRNYHVKEAEGHHVSPFDSIVLRMKYSLTFRVSNLL